jgi:hypothetical protein
MTYTTLLQWSIQRHVHDPTQRHARGLINVVDVSYTTSCPWPSLPRIHAQYNVVPVICITSIYHHLLVRLPPVGLIRYNYFCQWRSDSLVDFSINTTDCHNITKIWLKMALCTHTLIWSTTYQICDKYSEICLNLTRINLIYV